MAQSRPVIQVSAEHVKSGGSVLVSGRGFTPNRPLLSHLLKPDGAEYNPLRLRSDAHGEFFHKVDSTMLQIGKFELWIEDEASQVVSNRIEFTVDE